MRKLLVLSALVFLPAVYAQGPAWEKLIDLDAREVVVSPDDRAVCAVSGDAVYIGTGAENAFDKVFVLKDESPRALFYHNIDKLFYFATDRRVVALGPQSQTIFRAAGESTINHIYFFEGSFYIAASDGLYRGADAAAL